MAQTAFFIKQGDTAPVLLCTLKGSDGAVQDLTGATVRFSMMTRTGTIIVNRAACVIVGAATGGQVKYVWQTTDTALAGDFYGEFEVTFSDNSIETFPNNRHIPIRIAAQVA